MNTLTIRFCFFLHLLLLLSQGKNASCQQYYRKPVVETKVPQGLVLEQITPIQAIPSREGYLDILPVSRPMFPQREQLVSIQANEQIVQPEIVSFVNKVPVKAIQPVNVVKTQVPTPVNVLPRPVLTPVPNVVPTNAFSFLPTVDDFDQFVRLTYDDFFDIPPRPNIQLEYEGLNARQQAVELDMVNTLVTTNFDQIPTVNPYNLEINVPVTLVNPTKSDCNTCQYQIPYSGYPSTSQIVIEESGSSTRRLFPLLLLALLGNNNNNCQCNGNSCCYDYCAFRDYLKFLQNSPPPTNSPVITNICGGPPPPPPPKPS